MIKIPLATATIGVAAMFISRTSVMSSDGLFYVAAAVTILSALALIVIGLRTEKAP